MSMYPISTYDTENYGSIFTKYDKSFVYTGSLKESISEINYIPDDNIEIFEVKNPEWKTSLSKSVEKVADYIASIGGYMAGYPSGFAIGVYTRTNPLATAHIGGILGAELFPVIIKEIVT